MVMGVKRVISWIMFDIPSYLTEEEVDVLSDDDGCQENPLG